MKQGAVDKQAYYKLLPKNIINYLDRKWLNPIKGTTRGNSLHLCIWDETLSDFNLFAQDKYLNRYLSCAKRLKSERGAAKCIGNCLVLIWPMF